MKRNSKYAYQSTNKRKSTVLTISLIISGIIMTGLVVWVGLNDWNVGKSFKTIGVAIGVTEDNDDELKLNEKLELVEENLEKNTPEETGVDEVPNDEDVPVIDNEDAVEDPPVKKNSSGYIEGQMLPSTPTFIKGVLVASKEYPLPQDYAPEESEEARAAFDEMAAKALLDGYHLHAFSTYRSFDYQTGLYERYVERDGEEAADRYSARPGYSEHQTGLAFDIGEAAVKDDWASSRFGETEAGKWVASNAHRFGFIMRYPEGKEEITGYMHESWHFRYVGVKIAEEIYKQKITLEEYLGK